MKITIVDEDTGSERITTLAKFLELEILRAVAVDDITKSLSTPPTVFEIRITRALCILIDMLAERYPECGVASTPVIRQGDIKYIVAQLRDLL